MHVPNFAAAKEIADSLRDFANQIERSEILVTRIDFGHSSEGQSLTGTLEVDFSKFIRTAKGT